VSGDSDLLALDPFRGVAIPTPRKFISWLKKNRPASQWSWRATTRTQADFDIDRRIWMNHITIDIELDSIVKMTEYTECDSADQSS
jgi:hypothetical protein